MANKSLTIVILVLVLAAVVLGYAIYKQRFAQTSGPVFQFQQDDELNMSLEEKERLVLNPPKEDSPPEDKERHFQIARSIAAAAPYLDITNCERGEPVVFLVKEGEKFTVKNNDTAEHTISMWEKQTFTIPASATKDILPTFDKGPGVYGYGCNASPKEVGMILVTE